MRTYLGNRVDGGVGMQAIWVEDGEDTRPLKIKPSMGIYNHASEFNWGYPGSGPAQTALAILYDVTGQKKASERLHQNFKRAYVAGWGAHWRISETEIRAWLLANSVTL